MPSPDLSGQKVGKYTLGKLLGSGATGDVYAAKSRNDSVAIKLLDPTAARDKELVARFKREGETAQRLQHPNIIKVSDIGNWKGRPYLVMEVVHGGSLRKLLDRGAPATILSVLTETATALAYAHAHGVVHRDVKPENILLTRSHRVRVADFGLARAADQPSMTTDGKLMGTAFYMSPEQARGGKATGYSDVYAFGIMLYEALSGRRPFDGEETLALLYQHAAVEPKRPSMRTAAYPKSLGDLALACLAKDAEQRPTMAQVADHLAATQLRRATWRPRTFAALAVAALVVLAIAVPSILDPLCGDWLGGGVFRVARHGAFAVHHAVLGPPPHKLH